MLALLTTLDPLELGVAWNLSQKAVRPRINGERDLTYMELVQLSEMLGIRTSDLLRQHDLQRGA